MIIKPNKKLILNRRKFIASALGVIAAPSIVKAGSLSLLGVGKPFGGPPSPPYENLTFRNFANSNLTTNPVTFSNCAIGTANVNRQVIVCVTCISTSSGSFGVTIGGIGATQLNLYEVDGGGGFYVYIGYYAANVPSGTLADVVISKSNLFEGIRIGWWTVDVYQPLTPTSFDNNIITSGSSLSISNVSIPADSFALASLVCIPLCSSATINQSFSDRGDSNSGDPTSLSLSVADKEAVMTNQTVTWTTGNSIDARIASILQMAP